MIIHEFFKNLVYYYLRKKENIKVNKKLFYFWKSIDLVGILTTLAMYTPFSKQYRYTISNKKTALCVGITGLSTLLCVFVLSIVIIRNCFIEYVNVTSSINTQDTPYYIYLFFVSIALLSMSMFLVNLFPITCFDMGLIILGTNSKNRGSIVVFDGYLKLLFFFLIVLRFFLNISTLISNLSISLFI